MSIKPMLILAGLLTGFASLGQGRHPVDSLRCSQRFDSLSNRMLYWFPEKDAEFKGGAVGLTQYIQRRVEDERRQLRRMVTLSFTLIVEADGAITQVTLRSAPSDLPAGLVEKTLKALSDLPKARPAKCGGQKVAVQKIVPISLLPDYN